MIAHSFNRGWRFRAAEAITLLKGRTFSAKHGAWTDQNPEKVSLSLD
jgi:hypothetical protein